MSYWAKRPPTAASVGEAQAVLDTNSLVVVVGAGSDGRIQVLERGHEGPSNVPAVEHDRSLQDALALMLEGHCSWVAVTERGRYLGLLAIDNLYNASRDRATD